MRSAIYEGTVMHHRRHPIDHRFEYRVAMPLVDLDEVDQVCSLHPLWSNERPNVMSYRRVDYLGAVRMPLARAVRQTVEDRLGSSPTGPIAMLAQPRTWGWLFNPIALYYCFDPTGTRVEALVAEVTNTPWHERHAYVVSRPGTHHLEKALHVSPFFGMDLDYALSYGAPGPQLSLRISTTGPGGALFDAVVRLERREISHGELGRLIFSHPFMTMRVSAAIYRQAVTLWRAGAPFCTHPKNQRCRAVRPEEQSSAAAPSRGTGPNGATLVVADTGVGHG